MSNDIIGYEWTGSETVTCTPCGASMIRASAAGVGRGIGPAQPVPIHANELTWDDGIRCNECGARLCEPAPPPKSFEQTWTARMQRRADEAVARAERES